MGSLGVPWEYEAWLLDGRTEEPRAQLPWSAIEWQRVANDVSVGSVIVAEADAGPGCCDVFRHLWPWSTLLRIDRNGVPVWDGPVTGWSRPSIGQFGARNLTIRAHDRFALTWKRLIKVNRLVNGDPTSILALLLVDAGFGTAIDPYRFVVPSATATAESIQREYRVDRLERIYDAVKELGTAAGLFFTQYLTQTLVDQASLHGSLGHAGERPQLNERTVIDLPGIEVDGLNMTTIDYVGGAAQGPNGFPRIASSAQWAGEFLSCVLEAGYSSSRAKELADLELEALIYATGSASPEFSMEQTVLSPEFGGDQMARDLSNLLPGVLLDVDFSDESCAFDQPFVTLGYALRPDHTFRLTPVRSDQINHLAVHQIDVRVDVAELGRLTEQVRVSGLPHAEWDGTIPAGWPQ